MPEREFELRPVGVDYICDKCNTGVMELSGNMMLTTHPPLYPHQCNACGHMQNFDQKYPTVKHKRVLPD